MGITRGSQALCRYLKRIADTAREEAFYTRRTRGGKKGKGNDVDRHPNPKGVVAPVLRKIEKLFFQYVLTTD